MYAKNNILSRGELFPLLFQALTLSFSLVARRFAIEVSHTLAPLWQTIQGGSGRICKRTARLQICVVYTICFEHCNIQEPMRMVNIVHNTLCPISNPYLYSRQFPSIIVFCILFFAMFILAKYGLSQ